MLILAYVTKEHDTKDILQIDLGAIYAVQGITTAGRPDWDNDYVQEYTVQTCDVSDTTQWCTSNTWQTLAQVSFSFCTSFNKAQQRTVQPVIPIVAY